jgi:transposase
MKAEPPFSSELWEQIPAAVKVYIHALEARVRALEAVVQRLEATVQHLRRRLQQDSRPSLRPPSSDPPQATTKRPRRDPTGRRAGGQPGHKGEARALVLNQSS